MKRQPSAQLSMAIGRLSGDPSTPATCRMRVHPGPAGFTSFTKFTSVASSAAGDRNVTATQTTVVVTTVTISEMCAGTTAPIFAATKNPTATTNELIIAAI